MGGFRIGVSLLVNRLISSVTYSSYNCINFVENIFKLIGVEATKPKFKRRTTTNDMEITNAISTMSSNLSIRNSIEALSAFAG